MSAPVTSSQPADQEVLQWYTRARRVPTLIGRLPKGGRLWGGPYTTTQVVGFVVVVLVGQKTMGIWGRFGWVGNWTALACAAGATLFALRFVKTGGRDPLTALFAVLGLGTGASAGSYDGRPVRLPRSHTITHRVNAQSRRADPDPADKHVLAAPPPPAAAARPQTAVQRLLHAATTQPEEER